MFAKVGAGIGFFPYLMWASTFVLPLIIDNSKDHLLKTVHAMANRSILYPPRLCPEREPGAEHLGVSALDRRPRSELGTSFELGPTMRLLTRGLG